MAIIMGNSLDELLSNPNTPEARRHYHAVDISESIWNRMQEMGLNQTQLAEMLNKSCSQVSRMLSAQGNMTLQTISELEHVLGITLADTTPYPRRLSESWKQGWSARHPNAWGCMSGQKLSSEQDTHAERGLAA